ncbi:MAG: ABC transporter permease [Ilumatobacter sp.]|uniref:ABC transporter permease n=1 Tax=Ilumatobacter sp. TaxID=1967498 RepID=UPI003298593B
MTDVIGPETLVGGSSAMVGADRQLLHPSESPSRRFLRRFTANKAAVIAAAYLVVLALIAILAPWIAPRDPNAQDLANVMAGPFDGGVMGTDQLGRDVLSRMILASRIAVVAVLQAVAVGLALGVVPGLVAGYFGGRVDRLIMRVNDAIMSFPPLILAIAIVGVLGASLTNAMVAIGIVFAPTFLRLVRASVLSVREETFIAAARATGTPSHRIVRRHVLPNVLSPLLVQISLTSGFAMLAEASLSFLGLGVQPPESSWGSMLANGFRVMESQPWLVVFPGAAIGLTVLAFNVLGDGARDAIGREVRSE